MEYSRVKIETYLPLEALETVKTALHQAGAGREGAYEMCFSYGEVTGCWRPLPGSRPYEGTAGELSVTAEYKLETRCDASLAAQAVQAVRRVHPYETPVIHVIPLLDL